MLDGSSGAWHQDEVAVFRYRGGRFRGLRSEQVSHTSSVINKEKQSSSWDFVTETP